MIELKGKYNTAKVFTDNVDKETISQINNLLNSEISEGSSIRIMPDCHAGKGCVVGFTMTITDRVCPNLVGVDIGCGMLVSSLGKVDLDFSLVDAVIRSTVPAGFSVHETPLESFGSIKLLLAKDINMQRAELSIGTLGGGNHFIEIAENPSGYKYLIIHSGSRNLGKQVAEYWQRVAESNATGNKQLAYLTGEEMSDYLHDMDICQRYARINRGAISRLICNALGIEQYYSLESVHNYIDLEQRILRKGAVDAREGKSLIIPINMRDGSIIAEGKGNADWNFSAPHGAGRIMSRGEAKRKVALDDFRETMKDVYTTSISDSTVDESPFAYKPMNEILGNIVDTVDVVYQLKPLYNFKA